MCHIDTIFGKVINIQKQIGQGGNSMVCFGKLNNEDVAVKILINYNIIKSVKNYDGIVHQYFLGLMKVENYEFPYIVMKNYQSQLIYEDNISEEKLFKNITLI